jgi:diaminohydroxyphosphoribosylaminopyrimidine deaminase/5-amino-6-(5-phosphoribosylamino)uracil reductase
MDITLGNVIVFTSVNENTNNQVQKLWKENGLKIVYIEKLSDVLTHLKEIGVLRLLVEGGAKLLTSFIEEKLADELILYQAPVIIGKDGINFYDRVGLTSINHNVLKLRKTKRLGESDIKSYYDFV